MDPDESHIFNAAHLMVASLAGSLAHVTCKVSKSELKKFICPYHSIPAVHLTWLPPAYTSLH